MQLLPVWHLIKPKTKRLIEDLGTLRNLLSFLLNYSCVEFQELLEAIYQSNMNEYKSSSTGNKTPSHWLYLDPADAIFSVAKERTYKVIQNDDCRNGRGRSWLPPNIVPVLEEQPKWSILTEILAEIDNNIHFNPKDVTQSENNMTLIMCGTNRTVIQLTEYLSQCEDDYSKTQSTKKAPKMMKRLLKDHLEKFKAHVGFMSTNMKFNAQKSNASTSSTTSSPSKNTSSTDGNSNNYAAEQGTSAALQRKEQFRRNEGATAYGHNRRRVRGGSVMASVASSRKTYNNLDANTESPLESEARKIAHL